MKALYFIAPVVAYLLGSISFAVVFSKIYTKTDVRESGSGNAGTTNVMRVAGVTPGVLTFLCDILKGTASALVGRFAYSAVSDQKDVMVLGMYICAVACMLGHAYPIYFGFKGGKCAATSVGIFAVACPFGILAGILTFALTVAISRIVSLSTLVATLVIMSVSIYLNIHNIPVVVLTVVAAAIVYLRHYSNIKRLLKGEEKKFKAKK